jgi:hypothetical protein
VPAGAYEPGAATGDPEGGGQCMSDDLLIVITPLRKALERIQRKAKPLLATPDLLETEV